MNTLTDVRGTERSLVDTARPFGAGDVALFRRIYLQAAQAVERALVCWK